MSKEKDSTKTVIENRKARHDYHIHETYETGIVLTGTEVKSLRTGRANLKDSYARVENLEVFLHNMHISPYDQGNRFNHEPLRRRKLLMHKVEINKLFGKTREKGFTLIPLRVYFTRGKAKLLLGLATGKQNYDKRKDIAEKDAQREISRAFRAHQKGE